MRFLGTTRWTCWSATLRRVPLLALALLPAACATHWFRPATSAVLPDFGPLAPCELQPAAVRGKRSSGPKFGRGDVR